MNSASAAVQQRNKEVVQLVAGGLASKEIAHQLGICNRTVKEVKRKMASKLGYTGKRLDVFLTGTICGNELSEEQLAIFPKKFHKIVRLAVVAKTNREIAHILKISSGTVTNRLREIYEIANVWNRRELARLVLTKN